MEKQNVEKIVALINHWGVPSQLVIAMEEAAELQVVCSKVLRYPLKKDAIVDALGDSYVMLQTLCTVFGVSREDLEAVATAKLDKAIAAIAAQANEPAPNVSDPVQQCH